MSAGLADEVETWLQSLGVARRSASTEMRGAVLAALSILAPGALKGSSARHDVRPAASGGSSCGPVDEICRRLWPCGAGAGSDGPADSDEDGDADEMTSFLEQVPGSGGVVSGSADSATSADFINYLVLIADGSVDDEREIVADLKQSNVRVLSCGVGTFCNGCFLRTLANESRGAFMHALDPAHIEGAIVELVAGASGGESMGMMAEKSRGNLSGEEFA